MENKKITKREYFEMIKEIATSIHREDIVEFCMHEQELLAKKSSKGSLTKNQKDNEIIKETIVKALSNIGKPVTISELQTADNEMSNYSNQKLSALLNQLYKGGVIEKDTVNRKSVFFVK